MSKQEICIVIGSSAIFTYDVPKWLKSGAAYPFIKQKFVRISPAKAA